MLRDYLRFEFGLHFTFWAGSFTVGCAHVGLQQTHARTRLLNVPVAHTRTHTTGHTPVPDVVACRNTVAGRSPRSYVYVVVAG